MHKAPSLSRIEEAILDVLAMHGKLYGLQIVKASNGTIKRGTIYVTLSRMQDKGLVECGIEFSTDEFGIAHRLYSATAYGQRVLHACQTARALMMGGELVVG